MKRWIHLLPLSVLLCLAMTVSASAAGTEETAAADALHTLGLFQGTGTAPDGSPVYDLDRVPTRNQAVIMLVRLLGKEEEAVGGSWNLPFRDVAPDSLSARYIGYAYAHGLARGTTENTYSGTASITRNQYLLFLMRAMGYDNEAVSGEGGMTTAQAAEKAAALGISAADADATFTRGGVALLSYRALDTFLYQITPRAATLRESLGLGASPAVTNLALDVGHTDYDSYVEAYGTIQADEDYTTIRKELSVSGGTVVSYVWSGLPHGDVEGLYHITESGTRYALPLPRLDVWGGRAAPGNLSCNGSVLTYEVVIPRGESAVSGEPVRRAGTYRYTYNLETHSCSVTETQRFAA